MWRAFLTVSREIYHCHPTELNERQVANLREFVALAALEYEELPT